MWKRLSSQVFTQFRSHDANKHLSVFSSVRHLKSRSIASKLSWLERVIIALLQNDVFNKFVVVWLKRTLNRARKQRNCAKLWGWILIGERDEHWKDPHIWKKLCKTLLHSVSGWSPYVSCMFNFWRAWPPPQTKCMRPGQIWPAHGKTCRLFFMHAVEFLIAAAWKQACRCRSLDLFVPVNHS